MYESHFGITGPPFQLTADPSFYFDSKGHHRALVEFRRGLAKTSGFVVVSGEIGAGKTTLVRTLLAELDPAAVAVAQVLSTQLQADELLRAILFAFGVAGDHGAQADPASAVREFLVALARESRRAVLIVDEAQNLHQDAFEELVALLTRESTEPQAALQICLVGQPELREIVSSRELQALQERVVVACHLGPIDQAETRDYIEHRLRKVGWNGHPGFDAPAFDEIFRWTQGVPRKINLLCNRLMLSRFLTQQTEIDAAAVAQTARDLRVEIGDPDAATEPPPLAAPAHASRPVLVQHLPTSSQLGTRLEPSAQQALPTGPNPARQYGPLLCIVGGHSDHIKMAPLLEAIANRNDVPAVKLVRAYRNDALELNVDLFPSLKVSSSVVNLDVTGGTYAEQAAELMRKFEFVIDHSQPRAVVVIDGSDAALACGLVARRKDLPVVHVGAGLRAREGSAAVDMTRKLTDDLAEVLYTCEEESTALLAAEGVSADRIRCVGTPLIDSLQTALRRLINSPACGAPMGMPASFPSDRNGYALVVLNKRVNVGEGQNLSELVSMLRDVSRDVPLVWPMHARLEEQLKKLRLDSLIARERIACIPVQAYTPYVELLRNATCVLSDSWNLQEEAAALGIPCLMMGSYPQRMETAAIGATVSVGNSRALATRAVWDCLFNGGKRGRIPAQWDGHTAERIAEHISNWLPRVKGSAVNGVA